MRKKTLEDQLAECSEKNKFLKGANADLKADLRTTHALLLDAQKQSGHTAATLDFNAALKVVDAQISAKIEAERNPAKQWSLVLIRKGLKQAL